MTNRRDRSIRNLGTPFQPRAASPPQAAALREWARERKKRRLAIRATCKKEEDAPEDGQFRAIVHLPPTGRSKGYLLARISRIDGRASESIA